MFPQNTSAIKVLILRIGLEKLSKLAGKPSIVPKILVIKNILLRKIISTTNVAEFPLIISEEPFVLWKLTLLYIWWLKIDRFLR